MSKTKTIVTVQEAWERIEAAGNKVPGDRRANFEGETLEGFEFRDKVINASLNLKGAHILGKLSLCMSKFGGHFIDLDGARVDGDIILNGLEPTGSDGYSLYLRRASVQGKVEAEYTCINWLCVGGLRFRRVPGKMLYKDIRLSGTRINRGVSLDPQEG